MKFKSKNKIIALLLAFNYSAFASESFDGPWLRDIKQLNNPEIEKTALSAVPRSFVNMEKINEEINNAERNLLKNDDIRTFKNYVTSSHLASLIDNCVKTMGITNNIDKVKVRLNDEVMAAVKIKLATKDKHIYIKSISMNLGKNFLQNSNLCDAELTSIIMHELAHIKNQDSIKEYQWIKKQRINFVAAYFAGLPIFFKFTKKFQPTRFKILNTIVKYTGYSIAYPITSTTTYSVAKSRLYKKREYQADADSLSCHKDLGSSIDSLKKANKYKNDLFAQQNPDISLTESCAIKWLDYFFGTHPSLDDRISNLHKTMEEINYTASKG